MSTFDDLEAQLGIDMSDPREILAGYLAEGDLVMLEELVRLRRVQRMSKADVAHAMGRHRSVVTNFEKLASDPHLSTIRRYALAIGARITHHVELADTDCSVATSHIGDENWSDDDYVDNELVASPIVTSYMMIRNRHAHECTDVTTVDSEPGSTGVVATEWQFVEVGAECA